MMNSSGIVTGLRGYASYASSVTIPSQGVVVATDTDTTITSLGTAFSGKTSIRSISAQYTSINTIAANSFLNCTNLYRIYLPDRITSIGSSAFKATNIYDMD